MRKEVHVTEPNKKGLALSGGGFRATLYALGSLIRMNEDGLLTKLDTITAVSGGAIAAGYLMLKWNDLQFIPIDKSQNRYKAVNFYDIIVKPLLEFCSGNTTCGSKIIFARINPFTSAVQEVKKKYEKFLFGEILLKDVISDDKSPEFIFYGTNLDTGSSVRINKNYIRDYNIGFAKEHNITLAEAVSISSGFPPFLSPICLDGSHWQWKDGPYQKLPADLIATLREKLTLCDGGLYDNMGLEMLWKYGDKREYDVVFSCDAGAPFPVPWKSWWRMGYNWVGQYFRMSDIMINQQRALRKRMLVRNFEGKEYQGAYWSIENDIGGGNGIESIMSAEEYKGYEHLKNLGTQLKGFKYPDNYKLVNLGFHHTDCSLRSWYDPSLCKPPQLPFPSLN